MRFALALVAAATFASAQVVPSGLYFRFNEGSGITTANVAQPGVGGLNATLTGHTFGVGRFGAGLLGTGTSAHYTSNGWTTNLVGTSWTIEFWVNPAVVSTSISYLIGDVTSGVRAFWGGVAGAGNIIMRGTGVTDCTIPSCVATPNVWSHIAFVYDYAANPKTLTGYWNGLPIIVSTQTAVIAAPGGPFYIGNYSATAAGLNGVMDEVRLWLVARTPSEISGSYNSEIFPENIFSATTGGNGTGDLTLSLTTISPAATEGYIFLSQSTSGPIGVGPWFGLAPDALTWSGINTPLAPGNPLHYPIGIPGLFPDQPFVVPPGVLSSLAGQTWDTVAVVFAGNFSYLGKSSVQRLVW
jgi:hypothetical protein